MRIRGSGESRARERGIGLIALISVLFLASCSSSHPTTQRKTNEGHEREETPTNVVVKVGGLTIKPPSASQRNEVSRQLSLAEMRTGWQRATGIQPIKSLPNCSDYPSATLYGPISAPAFELPKPSVPSPKSSKGRPIFTGSKSSAPSGTASLDELEDSAIWVAPSSSVAKGVVSFLNSTQGKACMTQESSDARLLRANTVVPGASAVSSYLIEASKPSVAAAQVVFSKGRDVVMVVFDATTNLSSALVSRVLAEIAAHL